MNPDPDPDPDPELFGGKKLDEVIAKFRAAGFPKPSPSSTFAAGGYVPAKVWPGKVWSDDGDEPIATIGPYLTETEVVRHRAEEEKRKILEEFLKLATDKTSPNPTRPGTGWVRSTDIVRLAAVLGRSDPLAPVRGHVLYEDKEDKSADALKVILDEVRSAGPDEITRVAGEWLARLTNELTVLVKDSRTGQQGT